MRSDSLPRFFRLEVLNQADTQDQVGRPFHGQVEHAFVMQANDARTLLPSGLGQAVFIGIDDVVRTAANIVEDGIEEAAIRSADFHNR